MAFVSLALKMKVRSFNASKAYCMYDLHASCIFYLNIISGAVQEHTQVLAYVGAGAYDSLAKHKKKALECKKRMRSYFTVEAHAS